MNKSFEKFCEAWREVANSGAKQMNEATLAFFLTKNFGTSRNNFHHYKDLSLNFGFISANKDKTYSIHSKVIEKAFGSGKKDD